MTNYLYLTFDVEDFVNDQSIDTLHTVLDLLKAYNLKALFFVTGHMAEKLKITEIPALLETHEVGFHSSGHSIHPTIFEYCDVESYDTAFMTSLKRETSHIDPISGEAEAEGGLLALQDLFPSKEILAYRAPGFCCPPPHLEALVTLGIRCDFSWDISRTPVCYREIVFFPRPLFLDCEAALLTDGRNAFGQMMLFRLIMTRRVTIIDFHPNRFVNKDWWDGIYHKHNPSHLSTVLARNNGETSRMFSRFRTLLKLISNLQKLKFVKVSNQLDLPSGNLDVAKVDWEKAIEMCLYWPKAFFGYEPEHLRSQIERFFGIPPEKTVAHA